MAFLIAFVFAGCSGGNTPTTEEQTLVAQTFSEDCALCHKSGSIADLDVVHASESKTIKAEINSVSIDGGTGAVTIDFDLFQISSGYLIPITGFSGNSIRFTVDRLENTVGAQYNWQSYINQTETKEPGDPGNAPDGTPTPDGSTATQATSERANAAGGTFVDNGNGNYSYAMSFDITAEPGYVASLTHRVAMQVSDNAANAYFDWVPDGVTPLVSREIAMNASCNECHIRLGFHGGDRIQVGLCVTCHNPGSADAHSGNTVDFKVMIHKIHAGEALPEVEAGGEYAIWGHNISKNDYSTVVFPQDLRNCTKCHDGADGDTPEGDNWKNVPSMEACTSCHEAPDPVEYPTFPLMTPAEIEAAMAIPAKIAAAAFEYNIISITDTNPGDTPTVTFSITDPTNADAAYDILNDPEFTASGGVSRVAILIGWSTTDYTNTGSGSAPAQPVSIDPLAAGTAIDNLDGTFSVLSPTAIPANAVGSGVVAIEGHPAADFDGDLTYSDRVPVTGVVQSFPITDTIAEDRRDVVDIDNCNQCHDTLSLHGNNRTDNPQLCVICHNADATDIEVRPGAATAVDGKVEEAIDFKYMIHAIHAGSDLEHGFREEGIVVYGFRGSINDFSEVRLPSQEDNMKNCAGCHDGDTYTIPIDEDALPTTILTRTDLYSPDDDRNITPTAAVCSSCHDTLEAKTHMSEQGGQFDFVPFVPDTSGGGIGEAALCGPGPVSAQPGGHSTRQDCCSCHGFQ